MVYVFGGLDFPLFEVLLIVSVALMIGLVLIIISVMYVLKEVRQLRNLLKMEEVDIQRFEKGIRKLERFEGATNRVSDKIKQHIVVNLQKGFNWEQIKQSLIKQGWEARKLDEIYVQVKLK